MKLSKSDIKAATDLDGFGSDEFDVPPPGVKLGPTPYDLTYDHSPLPRHVPPPPLPRIDIDPSTVQFIQKLPNGLDDPEDVLACGVFRVEILNMGERLLKIFRGHKYHDPKLRGFHIELNAYQHLLHHGLCAAGVVPHCHGWTELKQSQWPISGKHDWLHRFRDDPKPLKILILEFLPNASRMTLRWTNVNTVQNAMTGLKRIHAKGIRHGDIHPRNILVLPGDRVVWVDFELASVRPTTMRKYQLEIGVLYEWLYRHMLPWKWFTLRQDGERDLVQLESITQELLSIGCTLTKRDTLSKSRKAPSRP